MPIFIIFRLIKMLIFYSCLAMILSGCETFTASMYGVSADTNHAIKALKINDSVSVGNFTSSGPIDMQCSAVRWGLFSFRGGLYPSLRT